MSMHFKTLCAVLIGLATALPCRADDAPAADAIALLKQAQAAAKAVKAATYKAEFSAEGELAKYAPKVTGTVTVARTDSDEAFRVRVAGTGTRPGSKTQKQFDVAKDGDAIVSLVAAKKRMIEGKLPLAGELLEFAMLMVMPQYFKAEPFTEEIEGQAKIEGAKPVGSVECVAVFVKYDKGQGEARWYFGAKDHLPRKVEHIRNAGIKGTITLTITDLNAAATPEKDSFSPKAPAGYSTVAYTGRSDGLAVGDDAPDWTLSTPDGKDVNLKKLAGKVVVLDFWATWCGPCKMAMPGVQKLYEHFKDNKNVAIFGVSTWEKGGDPAGYMKQQKFTYGLLVNGDSVATDYEVKGIPTFYVIGRDGKVLHTFAGFDPNAEKTLTDVIEKALPGGKEAAKTEKTGDKPDSPAKTTPG